MKFSAKYCGYAAALAAFFLIASAHSPDAATSTATMTVQMTITASCTVNSASTLNFGTQGVLTTNVDQTSTIQVTCTNTTPYNIGLNVGTGAGATVASRKMTSGGTTVNYTLYSNAAAPRCGVILLGPIPSLRPGTAQGRIIRSTAAFPRRPRPRPAPTPTRSPSR